MLELSELFAELSIGVMYVTHDQAEALALADRVVVMDRGRLVQEGPPEQVWTAPADAFVARFLGLSNVFPAQWRRSCADLGWTILDLDGAAGTEGSAMQVLIRPEAVRVSGAHASDTLEAIVDAVAFRGDHTQIWLSLASGERLEARRPGADRPAVGSRVGVAIDPGGVRPIG